jgi:hypothetical protein
MKVARKHILAALENEGKLTMFAKYAIKAKYYQGKNKLVGEFGWIISVVPYEKREK